MLRSLICTFVGHVDHGKCVSGDTLIPLADGTIISAKDLFDNNFDKTKAKKEGTDLIQETNKIIIFSNYGSVILPTKISHIWKRQKNELIEIKTAHGDILKTTPEHPYFTFFINGGETKAEDLKVGDYITIPRKIKLKDKNPKEIIFEKLKEKNFLCFLNINSKELITKIRRKGIVNIEKKLSIKHLGSSLGKARIRFQDLYKICKHFKVPEIKIYQMIGCIKNSSERQRAGHTSKLIKLPDFHDAEKIGYVLGCIAGDGHLNKTQVLLDNNDKEIQEKYSEYLKEIFGMDSFVKQNHTCKTVINNGGLTFKRFVKDIIGIPDKNKSSKIEVPEVALKNKEIFKGFFSGLIDTDGYVSHLNNSIELTSKSKLLIKQCSILLLNLEIQSIVYEKNGFYVLRIANKEYLNKFLENFNLRLKRKLSRIIVASKKAQSSRIFDIVPISKEEIKKLKLPSKPNKVIPYFNKYMKSQNLTREFLKKVLDNITEENTTYWEIKRILDSDDKYVKVISKRRIKNKDRYVYDFTVPGTHNFVAERTLVHNTTIQDKIRGTSVASKEAGLITQCISCTNIPFKVVEEMAGNLIKTKVHIPGFLFLDTPGHAAFSSLRKRGGNLADIAILVVDLNEGFKPQTIEALEILKQSRTPFIVAANKIDLISGYRSDIKKSLIENINSQVGHIKESLDNKIYALVGKLSEYGFNSERFDRVEDYGKQVAILPVSGKTGEGLAELMMVLIGLANKFLEKDLEIDEKSKGKATVLEVKEEKGLGKTLDVIVYDGRLKKNDMIVIGTLDEPIVTKVKALFEPCSLRGSKFEGVSEVTAAIGVKISATEIEEVISGMPLRVADNESLERIKEEIKKEVEEVLIDTDNEGIVVKADSLGSLEALVGMLKDKGVMIKRASIGDVVKRDIAEAKSEEDKLNKVILAFNVKVIEKSKEVKIINYDIIYKIIEDYEKWKEAEIKKKESGILESLPKLCKIRIIGGYVFRQSNPAVVGVEILSGTLKAGTEMMKDGKKICEIKTMQLDGENVNEATKGKQVAAAFPNVTFGRQINSEDVLYCKITEKQFRELKKMKKFLSIDEVNILKEISEIYRKENAMWGV